ncbi:hypothetical protein [Ohessyouella blattaphilus]|uniref:Uncharacterized protein n=1 Tax=Ohessyouella blattaphilus TaxID=2949333 RepID=A0ABT1ENP8_9FIRM|nr:hypothetical protein [Ohessyouella blattaphilus]MCP1110912.1 hypothetical protein [Ohessyouella blattaphilus]MCR8564306.1 hypothetical protein [Ohessyouella blattaphilus]
MNEFKSTYLWGINFKANWGLYFLATTFFQGVFRYFSGDVSIPLLEILQGLILALIMAIGQAIILPEHKDLSTKSLWLRTLLWGSITVMAIVFIALIGNWFQGLPSFCLPLFCLLMFCGCFSIMIGRRFENDKDTLWLNKNLDNFKKTK